MMQSLEWHDLALKDDTYHCNDFLPEWKAISGMRKSGREIVHQTSAMRYEHARSSTLTTEDQELKEEQWVEE